MSEEAAERVLAGGRLKLPNPSSTEDAGARIAIGRGGGVIYLIGELGTGKTTFCRGLIRAAGCPGPVKSPTFSLVESYSLERLEIHHFDLYRLGNPEELEFLGVRDYVHGYSLCLIEWPERGRGVAPQADLEIRLSVCDTGRLLLWRALSPRGVQLARNFVTKPAIPAR